MIIVQRPPRFKFNAKILVAIVLLVLLSLIPLFTGHYLVQILTFVFAFSIFAASWDIISGYTGQVNLGPVFPYGIAAFATALLDINTPLPIWLNFILGPTIATIAGLAMAGPSLRLTGNYLAIVTFAMGIIANQMALIQTGEEGLTQGVGQFFGGNPVPNYYFALILMTVCCGFMLWVVNSRIGVRLKAIREDQVVAEAIGINTTLYKMVAFALNNFFAGVAGSFITLYLGHVDFNFFQISLSFQIIAMAIVGGAGTIIGPILGVFLLYIPSSLLLGTGLYSLIVYGIIIIMVIAFARDGLLPLVLGLARRLGGKRIRERNIKQKQVEQSIRNDLRKEAPPSLKKEFRE